MPFTLSHVVLAPPIAKLTGNRLPLGALAIGMMTPDLYRLFTTEDSTLSHEWSGVIIPDLLIGLGFCLLWYGLYRPVVMICIGMHKPIRWNSIDQAAGFVIAVIAALILGICTHLIWDGLTHSDFRTFAFEDFLNSSVQMFNQTYPMHRILQIGSSVLTLPLLAWMLWRHYQQHRQIQPVARHLKLFAWGLFAVATLGGFIHYLTFALTSLAQKVWYRDLYYYLGQAINYFFSAWLSIFALGCIIFLVMRWLSLTNRQN